jgi:hypothetical protein
MISQIYSMLGSRVPGVIATSSDVISKLHGEFDDNLSQIYSAAQAAATNDVSSSVSDIYSLLSSRVPAVVTTASDLASQVEGVLSSQLDEILSAARAGGADTTSAISDIYSLLTVAYAGLSANISDVYSAVKVIPLTDNSAAISDVYSLLTTTKSRVLKGDSAALAYLTTMSGMLSDVSSDVLDVRSQVSDIYSLLTVTKAGTYSGISDIEAYLVGLSAQLSDVGSNVLEIAAPSVTVSLDPSDISQIIDGVVSSIGSAVGATPSQIWSDPAAVDTLSAARQGNSRTLVVQSLTSDVASDVLNVRSQVSDIYSLLSENTAGMGLSAELSDVYSAVKAIQTTMVESDVAAIASQVAIAVQAGINTGLGSVQCTITVEDDYGDPIADVDCTIVAHGDPDNDVVATGKTDAFGIVQPVPRLDPGVYDVYRQKVGVNFTNPQTITVT